jgi:uncharacterized protein (TIGR02246 family)
MIRSHTPLFVVALLLFSSCVAPPPEAPAVDLAAERAALMAADQAWAASLPDQEKFVSFVAEGGTFLAPDGPMVEGREAIRATVAEMFASPGFNLTWKATKAEVSASGDLGYTMGTSQMTMSNPEGQPVTMEGKYVTVWQKQADGQWKVVVDAPSSNAPMAAAH